MELGALVRAEEWINMRDRSGRRRWAKVARRAAWTGVAIWFVIYMEEAVLALRVDVPCAALLITDARLAAQSGVVHVR